MNIYGPVPAGFQLHKKLQRFMDGRREMADGARPLDWSAAEALALASLLVEGAPIRFSGQDSTRGTFSHRHAVLHDVETGETHTPLGLSVSIAIRVTEVDRRKVVFEFSVKDPVEEVGRGRHVRFVVETAKTRERLAAKRAKAGL